EGCWSPRAADRSGPNSESDAQCPCALSYADAGVAACVRQRDIGKDATARERGAESRAQALLVHLVIVRSHHVRQCSPAAAQTEHERLAAEMRSGDVGAETRIPRVDGFGRSPIQSIQRRPFVERRAHGNLRDRKSTRLNSSHSQISYARVAE